MTSGWRWRRARENARGSFSSRALTAFVAATPWITVGLMLIMLHGISGTLTAAEGVLFDLPSAGLGEGVKTDLVALALAMPRGTLVYFDDARYALDDGVSAAALGEAIGERARASGETTLLVLADRAVSTGDLTSLVTHARLGGVKRVLIANKHEEDRAE